MRKTILILCVLSFVISLCSCGVYIYPKNPIAQTIPVQDGSDSSNEQISDRDDNGLDNSNNQNGTIPCPEIEETVIYDGDILTLTVTGMKANRTFDTYDVQLTLDNHSDRTISYWSQYAIVNGYTIGITTMFQDVFAGMTGNINIGLDYTQLHLAGIKRIQDIVLFISCHYEDEDDYICDLEYHLSTSDAGAYEESYDFSGSELYDTDDYRIVMCANEHVTETEPAIIYIENKTDRNMRLTYDDIALNDVKIMRSLPRSVENAPNQLYAASVILDDMRTNIKRALKLEYDVIFADELSPLKPLHPQDPK